MCLHIPHHFRFFLFRRIIEVHIILMRTEASLLHQLRCRNLLINLAAHRDIAVPHGRCRIIWRCRCKCDCCHIDQLLLQAFQRFPPLASQMMAFVKTKRIYLCILQYLEQRKSLIILFSILYLRHGTMQCLICSHCDCTRIFETL